MLAQQGFVGKPQIEETCSPNLLLNEPHYGQIFERNRPLTLSLRGFMNSDQMLLEIEKLKDESPARAEIRVERGGPRLFLNGKEVYPLFALSAGLLKTATGFRESGINFLAPILGLNDTWIGPGKYDWKRVEMFFDRLLGLNPEAYFLPRLHLNAPRWWKDEHPGEMIAFGLPYEKKQYKLQERIGESGLNWNSGTDLYDVSYASEVWKCDTGDLLQAFLRHMESSPLRSRIMGYQVTSGMTGEWHYIGSRYLPDYSKPMKEAFGPLPDPEARLSTTYGLLRDPSKEREVVDFYRRFHELCAETILYFAGIVKEETKRRILCGTFYAYLLENVLIQEAGHLAPEKILNSPDIDYVASPYSYQHTNVEGRERWESDVVDGAGNWLGRARGVAGDGGYRVLVESLKTYGKLFIVEMDPSTYLEPKKVGEGGSGHDTIEGTRRILQRDLGGMFASGIGGWLYDFGPLVPPFEANRGWYDDKPIINEIRRFVKLGEKRKDLDISSTSQILAVYDAKSFFTTSHWKAEEPWTGFGISTTDFFNHWFLDSQARSLHRIGAPIDFLYRFDLKPEHAKQYRLMFMVNVFYLAEDEATYLRDILRDSQATVIWFYAPGFVTPKGLDLKQMERLTGFNFSVIEEPGPMMIRSDIEETDERITLRFGVKKHYYPRFSIVDKDCRALGYWTDGNEVAFAWKELDGWNSVYIGAAPIPVEILRWLARKAQADLWSTQPDIIKATRDAAMIVATQEGKRVLRLPKPMACVDGGPMGIEHHLEMDFGEVKILTAK